MPQGTQEGWGAPGVQSHGPCARSSQTGAGLVPAAELVPVVVVPVGLGLVLELGLVPIELLGLVLVGLVQIVDRGRGAHFRPHWQLRWPVGS
jgi:hypothetical protein